MDVVARHRHLFPDPLIILQCLVFYISMPKRKKSENKVRRGFTSVYWWSASHTDLLMIG
jgi:hypothetical protein